jgi:nucleoside-diphosphate-sugar epimerase
MQPITPRDTKILVTGGTGFIGSYLLRYLVQQGFTQVHALRRHGSRLDLVGDVADKIHWVAGDILDLPSLEEAMQGVSQVYHCAAIVSLSSKDASRMLHVNEVGTANVVNVALACGVGKLVHVSSIAALGRTKSGDTITEQTKWEENKLNSHYAISKRLSEMQIWRGKEEGLTVAIVNPALVIGSGFWSEGTARIMSMVAKGLPFYPVGGSGFVDVRDVARFCMLLMNSDLQGERYILCGENLMQRDFLSRVATVLSKRPPWIAATPLISSLAWYGSWLLSLFTRRGTLITRESMRVSNSTFRYNNSKSTSVFGFRYTPIDETIVQTAGQLLEARRHGQPASALPLN